MELENQVANLENELFDLKNSNVMRKKSRQKEIVNLESGNINLFLFFFFCDFAIGFVLFFVKFFFFK